MHIGAEEQGGGSFVGRWFRQPQGLFLRKAFVQIHMWTGLTLALYVVMISLTGSVLVYRNELYRAFSPEPVLVAGSGVALGDEALKEAARRIFPGQEVKELVKGATANHAVEVTMKRGTDETRRLLHPFSGADLGHPLPLGFRSTVWLLDLHDNLLSGPTGRRVNGIGAVLLGLLCMTGAIVWWPGIKNWRRSVGVDVRANWRRMIWSLHSAAGFWFLGFLLMWCITGAYLSLPAVFSAGFDLIQPFDEANPVERVVDRIQYWLAYLHFGRLGGRGIPGCGRGWCDSTTKAIWAAVGLVPPMMAVTGVLIWWNRVLRRRVN